MRIIKFINIFIIASVGILGLASCTKSEESTEINYNRLKFKLPISINEANSLFSLDSDKPLRKGNIDNREILLYAGKNKEIFGVTFYKKCDSHKELEETHKRYYDDLEETYKKKLKAFNFSFFTSLNGKYYSIVLENGLTIVLGDVMYNLASNNYVTISFFHDISEKELISYLNDIY